MANDRPSIGGQAVLEGVMMRAPERIALAVRCGDEIKTRARPLESPAKRHKALGFPVVRGVANFVQMLSVGITTLMESAEMSQAGAEEPSALEKKIAKATGKKAEDVMMVVAVGLAAVLSVGLFIVLPALCISALKAVIQNRLLLNLIEGGVRLVIFLAYLTGVSLMPDIRRTYQYHGAEHKVVNAWERGADMVMEECAASTRFHPRCGTSFLFLVMAVSILFFSLLPVQSGALMRVVVRLALLPVVAGISYEVLRYAARAENAFVRALRAPGLFLQRLTTREPDEGMIEVALTAFLLAKDGAPEDEAPAAVAGAASAAGQAQ